MCQNKTKITFVLTAGIFCIFCVGIQTTLAFSVLDSDLNNNGIVDSTEPEVVVDSNKSLSSGAYNFNNLVITNNATLFADGDPYATSSFKGVAINAVNITITSGSHISTDGSGYNVSQPGYGTPPPSLYYAGASYGGVGGGNTETSTYGSATNPTDLGSGAGVCCSAFAGRGGGALKIMVSNIFRNDGSVSANGGASGSGGSIYVIANEITGEGTFHANGGGSYISSIQYHQGGGGRIALYYNTSSYVGVAEARGGCSSFDGWSMSCVQSGTVGFFDMSNNDFHAGSSWRFQKNDGPFNFNNIDLKNSARATSDDGVSITANKLLLTGGSSLELLGNQTITIPEVVVNDHSTLTLSGEGTFAVTNMTITSDSTVTISRVHVLELEVSNLTIDPTSSISADGKGYGAGLGMGAPATYYASASYGGIGYGNSATSTYGSDTEPTDFGSGGNGYNPHGGGAARLRVAGMFLNNGTVSADGGSTSSGGSIYVTAGEIAGTGTFHANGGYAYCPNICYGPGGGGRIALYYEKLSFTGEVAANGRSGYGGTSGNGTVIIKQQESSCQTNCYSNVLFLPGLEASRLYEHSAMFENQLWEPNRNDDVEKLFLNINGSSVRDDIYTRDIIDEKNVLPVMGQGNIYKSFISQMNDLKTAGTINDWEAVPYDWRLSLDDILNNGTKIDGNISYLTATSSPHLIKELRRLAKNSKTGKVTIVAHSNGGLVTKALTEKLGTEATALIDKIIFVAVPQVGTPQAIGAVLHGYDQGLPFDEFPAILTRETARTLAKNMPSAYNLLPSAKYFTTVFDPVVTFEDKPLLAEFRARYGEVIETPSRLNSFITDTWRSASSTSSDLEYPSVGNAALLTKAEAVHATLDAWTPPAGVKLYEIAGWGEDTLSGVHYYQGVECVSPGVRGGCSKLGPKIQYSPIEIIDGDGTVVAPSALWTQTNEVAGKWWVDLREYNIPLIRHRKHADILEVSDLRTFIQNIITNSTSTLPLSPFILNTQPAHDPSDPVDARLSFLLHSPLNLSATDNLGNIISSATSTIPRASFKRYGEVQVLKVPKGTPITLNLEGYASGSFTLDMEEVDGINTVIASSTLSAIPSATSTKAKISFPDGTLETATPLTVDYNNDGTTDFTINPKLGEETVFDITPPEARISFSTTTKQLLVEGLDEAFTTIHTTATSTLIIDQTGNTTEIIFKKLKQEKKEIKLEMDGFYYNGIPVEIPKTTLQYEWSVDKHGNLRELEQKVTVGTTTIEAHYDVKKNTTTIKKKLKEKHDDERETKEVFDGLKILKIITEKGSVKVNY